MAVEVVRLKSFKFILLAGKAKYVASLDNLTSPRIGTPSRSHLHKLQNKVDNPTAMRTSGTRYVHLKRVAARRLNWRTRISNARVVKAMIAVGWCMLPRFHTRNSILSTVVWRLYFSSNATRPNIGMNCSLKRFYRLKDETKKRRTHTAITQATAVTKPRRSARLRTTSRNPRRIKPKKKVKQPALGVQGQPGHAPCQVS